MAHLHVHVPDDVAHELRVRAAQSGHGLDAEITRVLAQSVTSELA